MSVEPIKLRVRFDFQQVGVLDYCYDEVMLERMIFRDGMGIKFPKGWILDQGGKNRWVAIYLGTRPFLSSEFQTKAEARKWLKATGRERWARDERAAKRMAR